MTANATWIQNPAFRPRLQAAVQEGVNAYMLIFSRALRGQLSKPGTGRVYRVSQGKARGRNLREQGFHRASVPGRPPAADTGMLRRSWQIGENSLRGAEAVRAGGRGFRAGSVGSPAREIRPRQDVVGRRVRVQPRPCGRLPVRFRRTLCAHRIRLWPREGPTLRQADDCRDPRPIPPDDGNGLAPIRTA